MKDIDVAAVCTVDDFDGLVQERHNSSALALTHRFVVHICDMNSTFIQQSQYLCLKISECKLRVSYSIRNWLSVLIVYMFLFSYFQN